MRVYIYIYIRPSNHADSMELPDYLVLFPYCLLILVGPVDCPQCPHRDDVYKFASLLTLLCPCVGIYKIMCRNLQDNVAYEFISASPACLVHLTWIVSEMGGKWLYKCCFVGCCLQDLFKIVGIHKRMLLMSSSSLL